MKFTGFRVSRITFLFLLLGAITAIGIAVVRTQLPTEDSEIRSPLETLPPGFETYSEEADRIRTLFSKKKKAQPGEWLYSHDEGGQTFAQYVRARERKPLKDQFTTIYVQPLGEFDETQLKIVEETAEFLRGYFEMNVEVRDRQPFGEIPDFATRMRDDTQQVLSEWILNDRLKPDRPDDAIAVIGFVTFDLWMNDLNWVFGSASLSDRVGVWSLHRNGDPHESDQSYTTCLKRTIKTATHEIGHMYGIPHCIKYECCMNGSKSRQESDRRPMELCPECQPKIWWTCGAAPSGRSRNLADMAARYGWTDEVNFWKKQAMLLTR